jgi:mRNA interferase HigB
VRVIAKSTLRKFWDKYVDAKEPLVAWYREVKKAKWRSPADLKRQFGSASIRPGGRIVFNIRGNRYRLVTHVLYVPSGIAFIRFIGTHQEYDEIDVDTI